MKGDLAESMSSYRSSYYASLKNGVFFIFPLLVVLGNIEIWLGSSTLTLPLVFVFLLPIALIELLRFLYQGQCDTGPLPFVFLYILLLSFGVLAAVVDSASSIPRSVVSLLPVCVGLLTLFSFAGTSLPENVPKLMRVAGAGLSLLILYKALWLFLPVWWSSGIDGIFERKSELSLPLGHSNFLAVFLMFFSIFAWRYHKLLWLLMLIATGLTLSRFGIAFFLLAALCVWLLDFLRLSVVISLLCLLGVITVIPVWIFSTSIAGVLHNGSFPESLVARFDLWVAALELISDRPIWGGGPGGFTTYLELIVWPRDEWGTHNFILSQWIEFGALGLMIYFAIIARMLYVRSSLPRADEELVKLGSVMMLFYGLFENVVGLIAFEIIFAYLLCLLSARRFT